MGQIGLAFVNPAPLTKPNHVVNFAKRCEEMGLHSLWTIDRIAYDNLEPLTLLASAAAVTQKLRLGTSVLLGNTRHPSHLAKIIATIDFISNGRVTLGIGFGSRESDYKAVEIPFEKRGSRAVEQIQLIKRLWTEENVTHKGQFFQVENLTVGPRPIQKPHPPIWTGGSAEVALKRAGTWANGFICGSSVIPEFSVTWEKVAGYARAAGRNPNEIEKAGLTLFQLLSIPYEALRLWKPAPDRIKTPFDSSTEQYPRSIGCPYFTACPFPLTTRSSDHYMLAPA